LPSQFQEALRCIQQLKALEEMKKVEVQLALLQEIKDAETQIEQLKNLKEQQRNQKIQTTVLKAIPPLTMSFMEVGLRTFF